MRPVIGDHVDFAFGQAAGYLTTVQSGQLKVFAVLQSNRWWAAPEVPSGAGGSIGVGRVAHALPDGYTLSIGHTQTHVFNSAVLKLNYDVVNDFTPISLIARIST